MLRHKLWLTRACCNTAC